MKQPDKIIVFDNSCVLCDTAVKFIFSKSNKDRYYFTHLNSEYFNSHLKVKYIFEETDSVVLIENDLIYYKSEAALKIAKNLRAPYKYLSYAKYIPVKLRDFIYDLIAKYRYKIFGRKKNCEYNKELSKFILD